MLLRATLLQAFFSVASERMMMEQIDDNLLFRWFVGLETEVARAFLAGLLAPPTA